MASRKPLVLDESGNIQQLQSGDTLNAAVSENNVISRTAAATLIAGNVVYASSATEVNKARANASGTVNVVGFATAAVSSSANGSIQTSGVLTLTTTEWDALAGTTGGLAYNTRYFLSAATAGLITSTAPSTTGQYVRPLLLGLSTTEALIVDAEAILL